MPETGAVGNNAPLCQLPATADLPIANYSTLMLLTGFIIAALMA